VTQNPYSPPAVTDASLGTAQESPPEYRHGPAWYIVFSGSAIGGAGTLFVLGQEWIRLSIGLLTVLAMVFVGCVLGGLLFRIRSLRWPDDPTVRFRQVIYSLLAVVSLPVMIYSIGGANYSGLGGMMVGVAIGCSVACGIFASGTRRFRGTQNMGDQ